MPLTLEVWNLNHLISREVFSIYLKKHQFLRQTSLCLNLDFGTTLHMGFLSLDFFFFKVGINGWFISCFKNVVKNHHPYLLKPKFMGNI